MTVAGMIKGYTDHVEHHLKFLYDKHTGSARDEGRGARGQRADGSRRLFEETCGRDKRGRIYF